MMLVTHVAQVAIMPLWTFSEDEIASFSPPTQREMLSRIQARFTLAADLKQEARVASVSTEIDPNVAKEFEWTDRVDLSLDLVQEWMKAAQQQTTLGMRAIAEHGPIISLDLLKQCGVQNIGQFQSRVTIRTRTITKNPKARLLAWDWVWAANGKPSTTRYAVTPVTHASLRAYFNLN